MDKKTAAFFVLIFDSFLDHFGCPTGFQNDSVLEPLGQDAATMRFDVILFIFRDMQFRLGETPFYDPKTTPKTTPDRSQTNPRWIKK